MAAEKFCSNASMGLGKSQGVNGFILFCAGEDSGDSLGAVAVAAAMHLGFSTKGAGGILMQKAGLFPLVNFEELPVSGFSDIVPHCFRLRKNLRILENALNDSKCKAFVAVDYPGFNMALSQKAKSLNIPVLYISPPQIWAWKKKRVKKLADIELAVLFEFEKRIYAKCGLNAHCFSFPFSNAISVDLNKSRNVSAQSAAISETRILLFPGSRLSQMRRNMKLYLPLAEELRKRNFNPVFVASRPNLLRKLRRLLTLRFPVLQAPESLDMRARLFSKAAAAVAPPGTITLELALVGTPFVASARFEPFTYLIGRFFVRTKTFVLPNILLQKTWVPEKLFPLWKSIHEEIRIILNEIRLLSKNNFICNSAMLAAAMPQVTLDELTLEFFVKLIQGESAQSRSPAR